MFYIQRFAIFFLALTTLPISNAVRAQVPAADSSNNAPEIEMILRMSKPLVDYLANGPIELTMPIDKRVDRIPVRGSAIGKANLNVEFIPSDDWAQFELVLDGTAEATFSADAGPATAHASSLSDFISRKTVSSDGEAFNQKPAQTEMKTNATIERICSKRGGWTGKVVRCVARRVLARRKSDVDEAVNEIAKGMINDEIDDTGDSVLKELNQLDLFSETIDKYFPEAKESRLHMRTTKTHLLTGLGPAQARFPDFVFESNDKNLPELELWIRTRPIEEIFIKLLVDWEVVHDQLKEFLPEEEAKAIADDVKIESQEGWTVIRVGARE